MRRRTYQDRQRDMNLRFFQERKTPGPDLKEDIVKKELDFVSGLESEMRNPDSLLTDKGKNLSLYDLMLLDDSIKSATKIFKRFVLGVNAEFVAASEEPIDVEARDFVEKTLEDMQVPIWDCLDNLMDARNYGYKIAEKIWDLVDGKWVLKNLKFKHSMFYDFKYDENGNLQKLVVGKNYGFQTTIDVPDVWDKFVIFSYPYPRDGNMYGDSELREAYKLWWAKDQIQKFRNMYVERYGQPLPIVEYDQQRVTSGEKSDLRETLENLQDAYYIMVPAFRKETDDGTPGELVPKFKINWQEFGGSKGTDIHERAIDQLDKQIKRVLLFLDKLGLTESPGGSYSMSQTQFDIWIQLIVDEQGRIEDVVNKQIIKQLVDYNFAVENYPRFKFDRIDATIEAQALKTLIDAGVIDQEESWIRSYLKLPQLTEQEKEQIEEAKAKRVPKFSPFAPAGFAPGQDKPGKPSGKDDEDETKKVEYKTSPAISQVFNYKKVADQLDQAEADFLTEYDRLHREVSAFVMKQVESKKIIQDKNLKGLDSIKVPKTDLKRLITNYLAKLYVLGKADAAAELKARAKANKLGIGQYKTFIADDEIDWLDRSWVDRYLAKYGDLGILSKADKVYLKKIRDQGFFITGEIETRLTDLFQIVDGGINSGMTNQMIKSKLETYLAEDRQKYAITIARTNEATAYNNGRMNLFTSDVALPLIEAYQYAAIMDEATTPFCAEHDGQIIQADDPELTKIIPPNHFNCRSTLVPIMRGEGENESSYYRGYEEKYDAWGKGVSDDARKPAKGFGS